MKPIETILEEWSKDVDNEMPDVFIIDGEKEIAKWWIDKILARDEEMITAIRKLLAFEGVLSLSVEKGFEEIISKLD